MSHVLIVEDDPVVREMLKSLLRHHGYPTDTAGHGREALDRVNERRPSLVLLDLKMPVMNGWEFRQHQLATPTIADVPVICITSDPDASRSGSVLGARCLEKPIDLDIVMDAVRSTCGKAAEAVADGLKPYDPWVGPEVVGECFVHKHGRGKLRCEIRTHAAGWELRLWGARGIECIAVCPTQREVFDTVEEWESGRARTQARGTKSG